MQPRSRRWLVAPALLAGAALACIGIEVALDRAAKLDVIAHVRNAPPLLHGQSGQQTTAASETTNLLLRDAQGAIAATLRVPNTPGPHPVVVVLGALRTGRGAVDLVAPQLPYAVAALDYAHSGRRLDGPAGVAALPHPATLLRTPVLLVGSNHDTALPRRCSELLWQSACAPRQRVELPGGHIDSGRKEEILRAVTRHVRAWIEARDENAKTGEAAAAARL